MSTSSAQQRGGRRALRVDLAQGALEDVHGPADVAPRQVDGGQRARRLEVQVEAVEQLLRLLDPALADAQVGEPDRVPRCAATV